MKEPGGNEQEKAEGRVEGGLTLRRSRVAVDAFLYGGDSTTNEPRTRSCQRYDFF